MATVCNNIRCIHHSGESFFGIPFKCCRDDGGAKPPVHAGLDYDFWTGCPDQGIPADSPAISRLHIAVKTVWTCQSAMAKVVPEGPIIHQLPGKLANDLQVTTGNDSDEAIEVAGIQFGEFVG